MNTTPAASSTGVEPRPTPPTTEEDSMCIHDLPIRTCGLCTRHADTRDPEFTHEFGDSQGYEFYGELGSAGGLAWRKAQKEV